MAAINLRKERRRQGQDHSWRSLFDNGSILLLKINFVSLVSLCGRCVKSEKVDQEHEHEQEQDERV